MTGFLSGAVPFQHQAQSRRLSSTAPVKRPQRFSETYIPANIAASSKRRSTDCLHGVGCSRKADCLRCAAAGSKVCFVSRVQAFSDGSIDILMKRSTVVAESEQSPDRPSDFALEVVRGHLSTTQVSAADLLLVVTGEVRTLCYYSNQYDNYRSASA